MKPETWWYVTRATGLGSWVLLTLSVALGLLMSTRLGRRLNQAWATDLHRFFSGFAFVLVGAHLAALVADTYTHFDLVDLFVPLASEWRPGAVAWGVVALYLALVVELTSLVRNRLSRRTWIVLHQLSLPAWACVTVHLLQAGAEARNRLLLGAVLGSVVLVTFLLALRVLAHRELVKAQRSLRRRGDPPRTLSA